MPHLFTVESELLIVYPFYNGGPYLLQQRNEFAAYNALAVVVMTEVVAAAAVMMRMIEMSAAAVG